MMNFGPPAGAEYLTVQEAAEALRVSIPTVRKYIHSGDLPATRLPGKNGRYRVHRDALSFVMSQATKPGESRRG